MIIVFLIIIIIIGWVKIFHLHILSPEHITMLKECTHFLYELVGASTSERGVKLSIFEAWASLLKGLYASKNIFFKFFEI